MSIGEKLLELRKKYKYSQEDLAAQLNVSRQTISNWENNITSPDLLQAKAISCIFNISLDELVDNNIHDVLVEKISNTEKLAGLVIKILKVMGILILVFIIINCIAVFLYSISGRTTSTTMRADITCSIDENTYSYFVEMDEHNNISKQAGDSYIKTIIKDKSFKDGNALVRYIEQYFMEHGGSCQ